ncbi:DUF6673 family protein [Clostridium sp. UBA4548]|uniref:DUF6673 family protein n=1 Tax=Clostridium sp. UBA4548 TaxID=1946361 RepID=UPI0025C3FAF5|nr:DUF6673 family protein [Clostridium sp. UBA4548]
MKINGVELQDIDIFDAEVSERYENALKDIQGIEGKIQDLKVSESIRIQCDAIFKVFNVLFGEGTDKKVFGNKVNLLVCLKSLEELVVQIDSQKAAVEKLASKYQANRATRRGKK